MMSLEANSGTHMFEIVGYSLKKGLGVGRFVRSPTFTVGGLDWSIRFYPDGNNEASKANAVAFLELMSSNTQAYVRYAFGFVNQDPLMMQMMDGIQRMKKLQNTAVGWSGLGTKLFRFSDATRLDLQNPVCMSKSLLDLRTTLWYYVVDDCLKIQCDITVDSVKRAESEIEAPPCDMMQHFGNLLKSKKGVDVAFLVGGETIEAHKIVLAARSPVFMAELLGPMRESGRCRVTVEDMQPEVFRALLHFIYNDSLPDMSDLEENDYRQMMCHLLVAADRYAMDRMKLVCQSTICKNLDVETVATTLALADQHNCDRLRAACIEFIVSPRNKDAVAETQGYADLKRTCPSVFIDLFERKCKLAKHG